MTDPKLPDELNLKVAGAASEIAELRGDLDHHVYDKSAQIITRLLAPLVAERDKAAEMRDWYQHEADEQAAKIERLEAECRGMDATHRQLAADNERLEAEMSKLMDSHQAIATERDSLRAELVDAKGREERALCDLGEMRESEKMLSDAFVRIRGLVGTFDNCGDVGEHRFEKTEAAVKHLAEARQPAPVDEAKIELVAKHCGGRVAIDLAQQKNTTMAMFGEAVSDFEKRIRCYIADALRSVATRPLLPDREGLKGLVLASKMPDGGDCFELAPGYEGSYDETCYAITDAVLAYLRREGCRERVDEERYRRLLRELLGFAELSIAEPRNKYESVPIPKMWLGMIEALLRGGKDVDGE